MSHHGEQDNSDVARYVRGLRHFRHGRLEAAAGELEALLPRGDGVGHVGRFYFAAAQRALGAEAARAGDLARADRHLRRAIAAAGRDSALPACLTELYAASHRREQCLREMDKAVETGGDDADARRKLAQAHWQAGRREEAYLALADALRRHGDVGGLHLQMGLFHAAEERYAEARASFARAAEIDGEDADAHRYLALAAAAEGDLAAAVTSFQQAVDLRPTDSLVARQLLAAAKAAADGGQAVTVRLPAPSKLPSDRRLGELADYVAAEPDFAEALLALPPSEADEELFALLAGVVELAVARHPAIAELHLLASRALERLGQIDAAIERARGALAVDLRFARARVQLADLYARAGRGPEAVGHMERAIADGADWADVHLRLGVLLGRLGRTARARSHFERALKLNAHYGAAADALAALAA